MRISYLVAGCAAAALLSGCGDPDNETATNANGNIVAAVPVETVAVVDYDLTPEQQTRRDAVNMTAYRTEVQSNVIPSGRARTPTPHSDVENT